MQRRTEVIIDTAVDPAHAFRALVADSDNSFWLDGGSEETSYLGHGVPVVLQRPVLASVRAAVMELDEASSATGRQGLGLVGWFGFDLASETTGVPVHEGGGSAFLRVEEAIAIDRTGVARLVCRPGASEVSARERARRLREALRRPQAKSPPATPMAIRWRDTADAYLAKIAECQRQIRNGEAYVLCLTTQLFLEGQLDPMEAYLTLRAVNGTGRSAFLRVAGVSLLSTSPEEFLRIGADRTMTTSPIKGTRPRAADPVADAALRQELGDDEKERAENLMIVDLMRNDLARVCDAGSVDVTRLFAVESFAHVHQLVSTLTGRLSHGNDAIDAVAACFPAGSMTGAPKVRALELLGRIESGPRGVYSGAYGYFGFDGSAQLAMTIRSIVHSGGRATIGTGGGITALSDPLAELAEIGLKVRPLLRAVGIDPDAEVMDSSVSALAG